MRTETSECKVMYTRGLTRFKVTENNPRQNILCTLLLKTYPQKKVTANQLCCDCCFENRDLWESFLLALSALWEEEGSVGGIAGL